MRTLKVKAGSREHGAGSRDVDIVDKVDTVHRGNSTEGFL